MVWIDDRYAKASEIDTSDMKDEVMVDRKVGIDSTQRKRRSTERNRSTHLIVMGVA